MSSLKNSFRHRLFAAMLLSSLLPLLICSVLMVQITRLRMENKAREDMAQQSAVLCQSLSEIRQAVTGAAARLTDTEAAIHALGSGVGSRLQTNSLLFDATDSWRNLAVFDLYDTAGVCRYSTRGTLSQNLPTDWGVLYGAFQAQGEPVYYATEDPADTASALLLAGVRLEAEDGCSGYLVMRLYSAGFHVLLDGKYVQSDVLVLSRFFRPIYGSQTGLTQVLAPQLRQELLEGNFPEDGSYVYSVTHHDVTGLNLVLRQPKMFTATTVRLLTTAGLVCVLVCVFISALVSLPLSRQIAAPLENLMAAFGRVQQDKLETQLPVDRQDEFGQLADRFNHMVHALSVNRQELLTNQQELNQAQIRMLQAQLNPHFLCNTLDTMKWISKINQVPQVALMSTNLADILRFCISPAEFVPLQRELEILERYVEIQKIRLSDSFTFEEDVPEKLRSCTVPKMLLQPLAENAILHGLSGVSAGQLLVTARETDEKLLEIRVCDNGCGLPPELLGPYRPPEQPTGHLGLLNVDTILRKHYGERFGLRLENREDGIGACVVACLPIEKGESQC